MIKRQSIKSCCQNSQLVFITQKPIRRSHLDFFRQNGYDVPEYFEKAGMFYVSLNSSLIARAAFGTTNIQVTCNDIDCPKKLDQLEKLLDQITLS